MRAPLGCSERKLATINDALPSFETSTPSSRGLSRAAASIAFASAAVFGNCGISGVISIVASASPPFSNAYFSESSVASDLTV